MGMLSTIDLLAPTCLAMLRFTYIKLFTTIKAKRANLERRSTVLSLTPSVSIPCKSGFGLNASSRLPNFDFCFGKKEKKNRKLYLFARCQTWLNVIKLYDFLKFKPSLIFAGKAGGPAVLARTKMRL